MGFTPSARMLARRHNVDVASLLDILSHCRPYPSPGELDFIVKYLDGIEGMQHDEIGNRYIRVPNEDGSKSTMLWSCHTDSVHSPTKDGRQNVKWDADGNIVSLNEGKPGQCLGADDGAGMWLLLEMLKENRPGLYIFHRGEEKGGVGSRWLLKNTPQLLEGIQYAVAFDRHSLTSIITHQGGMRCCSDDFAHALGAALIDGYALDDGGSFTDTKVYVDIVPECTNVSVGYYDQHGPRETLDVRQCLKLRDALLKLDATKLPVVRKAGDKESRWPSYTRYSNYTPQLPVARQQTAYQKAWGTEDAAYDAWLKENTDSRIPLVNPKEDMATLTRVCRQFPEAVARILTHFGVTSVDVADTILGLAGIAGSVDGLLEASANADDDLFDDDNLAWHPSDDIDERVLCPNCEAKMDVADIEEDMRCLYCFSNVETAFEDALAAQDDATGVKLDRMEVDKLIGA